MQLPMFRGAKWRGFHRWLQTIGGISFIAYISGAVAQDLMRMWPSWSWLVCGVMVITAVFLSWLWFKKVRKAAEDGEFD